MSAAPTPFEALPFERVSVFLDKALIWRAPAVHSDTSVSLLRGHWPLDINAIPEVLKFKHGIWALVDPRTVNECIRIWVWRCLVPFSQEIKIEPEFRQLFADQVTQTKFFLTLRKVCLNVAGPKRDQSNLRTAAERAFQIPRFCFRDTLKSVLKQLDDMAFRVFKMA